MTSATDNRMTELLDGLRNVGNLHEFAELFGFNWYDESDWTWHDVAVKMADDLEQAIAATLGSGTCEFKPFKDEDWDEPNAVRGVCSKCSALMYGKDNYCPNCGARVRGGAE